MVVLALVLAPAAALVSLAGLLWTIERTHAVPAAVRPRLR
jgi:hypothetical protein